MPLEARRRFSHHTIENTILNPWWFCRARSITQLWFHLSLHTQMAAVGEGLTSSARSGKCLADGWRCSPIKGFAIAVTRMAVLGILRRTSWTEVSHIINYLILALKNVVIQCHRQFLHNVCPSSFDVEELTCTWIDMHFPNIQMQLSMKRKKGRFSHDSREITAAVSVTIASVGECEIWTKVPFFLGLSFSFEQERLFARIFLQVESILNYDFHFLMYLIHGKASSKTFSTRRH
jgi:hypothetical protein